MRRSACLCCVQGKGARLASSPRPSRNEESDIDSKRFPSRAALLLALWGASVGPVLAQSAEPSVDVQGFKVSGNSLLDGATVDAVLAPFRGRRTLTELRAAAAALQEAYRGAGYGAVVVFVPEQTLRGGEVALGVLEGKIVKVEVTGQQQFSAEAVRRSLPALREGQTPRVRAIDTQMTLANENPARQLALTLEPGARQGEVDARISASERPLQRWTASVDNTGNSQTGPLRAALTWRHADISGADDVLSVTLQTSPSKPAAVRVASLSYSRPFYEAGLRLDAYAAYSNVDGGSTATAAGNLQFVGRGNVFGARLTKLLPRWRELDQRLTLGWDRRDYLNDCGIEGLPAGACGPSGESVTVQPLTLEYTLQSSGDLPAGLNLAFSRNLDLGGSKAQPARFLAVRDGAPLPYQLWRLGGFVSPQLGRDWKLSARLAAQVSSDALVPGEQFGVAGAGTVRGYAEREVVGDSGYALALELMGPNLLRSDAAEAPRQLRMAVFGDAGRVSNRLDTECRQGHTRCSLAAFGVGVRWAAGPGQLRLDIARAGQPGTRTDKGDWRVHLAGSWIFE